MSIENQIIVRDEFTRHWAGEAYNGVGLRFYHELHSKWRSQYYYMFNMSSEVYIPPKHPIELLQNEWNRILLYRVYINDFNNVIEL